MLLLIIYFGLLICGGCFYLFNVLFITCYVSGDYRANKNELVEQDRNVVALSKKMDTWRGE